MKRIKTAFTLIELLVVIAIIAVLGAGGLAIVRFNSGTRAIASAQQSMMIMFQEARIIAITKQTKTRIIIYKGDDLERKLRQVGIIYETYDIDGNSKGWVAANKGYLMPRNVFFVPDKFNTETSFDVMPQYKIDDVKCSTFNNNATGVATIVGITDFPSIDPQTCQQGNGDWYNYEFTPDGLSENPGARIILSTGVLNSKGKFMIENPFLELGFIIRRTGITVGLKNYNEIEESER